MYKVISIAAVGIMLTMISCTSTPTDDTAFVALANNYIDKMLELNPQWATSLGDHRYDHLMGDHSLDGIERDRVFNRSYLDSLDAIDPSRLSQAARIDYEMLHHHIRSALFRLDTLRSYEWNPRSYGVGGAIYSLLARDFAPLEERLGKVKERLAGVAEVLRQARINLKNPPRIFTETAIRQNQGTISLIRDGLNDFVAQVPGMEDDLAPVREQAVAALEAYGVWLEDTLLARSDGDFRLGAEKYRAKLRYSLHSDLAPEVILERAEADLAATQAAMYETALPLFETYFPDKRDEATLSDAMTVVKAVLDRLADDHPNEDNVVEAIRGCLDECVEFVRANNLVTVPDEPIEVIVMPEFERGVAIGYCDSPGPLEEKGKAFYAISPPPEDWDEARVESYFREYNYHMLRDLTIHEGMPGHYLQIAHANKVQAPTLVRAIFGSGTFVEGWATYAEELMVEHGFGGPEMKMQQLKMRLRMIINVIIDQKIHMAGMTEEEAMDLMMTAGFQEEGEAAGKWRRACLTSTQLSTYYVGNIEMSDIRTAYEAKHGRDFDVRAFHDELLSFGSPAPKYIRGLMDL